VCSSTAYCRQLGTCLMQMLQPVHDGCGCLPATLPGGTERLPARERCTLAGQGPVLQRLLQCLPRMLTLQDAICPGSPCGCLRAKKRIISILS